MDLNLGCRIILYLLFTYKFQFLKVYQQNKSQLVIIQIDSELCHYLIDKLINICLANNSTSFN